MYHIVDQVSDWSHTNRVQLNSGKCKKMGITFAKRLQEFEPLHVDGKDLEVVETVKLLGLTISNNLTWNAHIREVVKKAAKRLYFLVQLKRSKVPTNDLVLFYTACIRFIMDYAAPVFHHALPQYLMNELTRVEKQAMYIIFPNTDYKLALEKAAVVSVLEHHKRLCDNLFKDIVTDPRINCITYFHPDTRPSLTFVTNAFLMLSILRLIGL